MACKSCKNISTLPVDECRCECESEQEKQEVVLIEGIQWRPMTRAHRLLQRYLSSFWPIWTTTAVEHLSVIRAFCSRSTSTCSNNTELTKSSRCASRFSPRSSRSTFRSTRPRTTLRTLRVEPPRATRPCRAARTQVSQSRRTKSRRSRNTTSTCDHNARVGVLHAQLLFTECLQGQFDRNRNVQIYALQIFSKLVSTWS